MVTVGTTRYDKLIAQVASLASSPEMSEHRFLCQRSDGLSFPETDNYKEVDYIQCIEKRYPEFDLIITHAGAGSIFSLIDYGKKIIIVPNLERIDKHQADIAKYMGEHDYAIICWDMEELGLLIKKSIDFQIKPFKMVRFFKDDEFVEKINNA
nr:PssE/Cps14G family polysaccharide biosynthesis glycosyltransferase [Citrobacter koseri]